MKNAIVRYKKELKKILEALLVDFVTKSGFDFESSIWCSGLCPIGSGSLKSRFGPDPRSPIVGSGGGGGGPKFTDLLGGSGSLGPELPGVFKGGSGVGSIGSKFLPLSSGRSSSSPGSATCLGFALILL